ncbi:MAG: UDP-N-acetylmuramate dehydrogenase [Candidatus Kapaibacterium sp.]|jgi:UDP-N-acetylmuramate dehydrogenase|nr:UDP-N-acetylmuramate dehydrogenase [Candidatus Kapabacteria bacterium]
MNIIENFSLNQRNTFGLSSIATNYACVLSADDLLSPQLEYYQDVFILGGGSNVILPPRLNQLTLSIEIKGIHIEEDNDNHTIVSAGAGEIWHDFVVGMIESGIYGLENLALIPGKVGAAPIQNIGAYGVEQEKFFYKTEVFDRVNRELLVLYKNECNFAYRDSVFKKNPDRYVILKVYYLFPKQWEPVISYKDIENKIASDKNFTVNPENLLKLIVEIRRRKLPSPEITGNAGSFFKNPIISKQDYLLLKEKYPDIPAFEDSENYKLSAAKLIELAGWKGKKLKENSGISVSPNHSLVLINTGNGTYSEIIELSERIIEDVFDKFKVKLEREVNIIK